MCVLPRYGDSVLQSARLVQPGTVAGTVSESFVVRHPTRTRGSGASLRPQRTASSCRL